MFKQMEESGYQSQHKKQVGVEYLCSMYASYLNYLLNESNFRNFTDWITRKLSKPRQPCLICSAASKKNQMATEVKEQLT